MADLLLMAEPLSLAEARVICGAPHAKGTPFSKTSKMPWLSYSIPAADCNVGSRMAKLSGTVCSGCYALKGSYAWSSTQVALKRRLAAIDDPRWSAAMIVCIADAARVRLAKHADAPFRWHDSGDLQSADHLAAIVEIADALPHVDFWIPTREARLVADYLRDIGPFPANLRVRVSMPLVDGPAPTFKRFPNVSTVSTFDRDGAHNCPSRFQNGECQSCRACWSDASWIDYHLH